MIHHLYHRFDHAVTAFRGLRVVHTIGVAVLSISCGLARLFTILYVVFAIDDQPIFIIINVANVCTSYFPTDTFLLLFLASVILPIVFKFYELVRRLYGVERLLYDYKPRNLNQFRQY